MKQTRGDEWEKRIKESAPVLVLNDIESCFDWEEGMRSESKGTRRREVLVDI